MMSRLDACPSGLLMALLAPCMVACALTSKAEPIDVRYFSPELMQREPAAAGTRGSQLALAPLRLGRVESGPHLRERIAHRESGYELGYYDDLRWLERPEVYVRRALGRALFERRGLQRVLAADAPTLDVEVVAFEDIHTNDARAAQVRLLALLFQGSEVIWEGPVTARWPVTTPNSTIEGVVAAMSRALDTASESLAGRVENALRARETPSTPGRAPCVSTVRTDAE